MGDRGPEPGVDSNACPRCGLPFAEETVEQVWVCNRCRRKIDIERHLQNREAARTKRAGSRGGY